MIAFRADAHLDEKLRRAARAEKRSKTEIIREALNLYLGAESSSVRAKRPGTPRSFAQVLKGEIGCWDGPEDASANTGGQLREFFHEKDRTRRL